MNHPDYIAKLKKIRDQLWASHVETVMSYRKSSVREDLPKVLSSYESVQALDRIIAAEEGAEPTWVETPETSDTGERPLA